MHTAQPDGKGKGLGTLLIALLTRYMSRLKTSSALQSHFTISEVAADWHELMIPWRIMRPSIARDGEPVSYYSFPVPLRVGG